jgi:hypothetical protein
VSEVQPIIHNRRLAALVVDGQAIISERVPQPDRWTVQAMCLYALEVTAGRLPGPYSAARALAYARAAAAARN